MIERWHRQLKSAIKCLATEKLVEALPAVLLGIQCSLKEDLKYSASELVFGNTLCLFGEFFRSDTRNFQMPAQDFFFLQNLRNYMQDLQHTLVSRHSKSNVLSTKIFLTVLTYIFVRQGCVRKPLQQPCDSPFEIISHNNNFFTLLIKGKKSIISVDRLKPAFMKRSSADLDYNQYGKCVRSPMHYNSFTKENQAAWQLPVQCARCYNLDRQAVLLYLNQFLMLI
ncbi:pol polyprotein [Trichonephila clavata]|uniref:Pol polyprotein n=1 Tax=Trichonephila clavata TaxID=2740835 RepID=A0A8X6KJD5_TRICU|nr:pol polyprotein [Trichonephila clavata]